jgi:hypothetical protein
VRDYHRRLTDLTTEQVAHTTDEQGVHHERYGERGEFRRDASVHASLLVNWQLTPEHPRAEQEPCQTRYSRGKPEFAGDFQL